MTTTTVRARMSGIRWADLVRRHGAVIVLAALLVFNIIFSPGFLSVRNLLYVQLRQAAPVALIALGMALIIATGGIDLSVGAIVALSGQAAAALIFGGTPTPIALAVGVLIGVACGLFNGTLVARFGIQPMIATLVLFTAGRGLAQVLTGGRIQSVNDPLIEFLGLGAIAGIPISVVALVVVAAIVMLVCRLTPAGTYLLAVGGNENAATLSGVNSRKVKTLAYMAAGTIAGLVGLLELGRIQASDATNAGLGIELEAIAAVAVAGGMLSGGTLSPGRTIIGALMLRLLQNTLVAHGVPREVAQVAQGLIIVAAIYVQRSSKEAR